MLRCLAARCRSTALEWLVPRLPTLGCHQSCCVVCPCSHVRRGCSATSLKSCVTPSHLPSTQRSIEMPSINRRPATTSQNNARLTRYLPCMQVRLEGGNYGKPCRRPRHHP